MSMEDVIAGFHNLANLQKRDEQWTQSIGDSVERNSGLLNALVTRVNTMDTLSLHQDVMTKTDEKVNGLEQHGAGKEWVLRGELSAMAAKLEAQHAELVVKLAEIDKGPILPPGIAPGAELLSLNMNKLNIVVDEMKGKVGALEKHAEQAVGRINDLEVKSSYNTHTIGELSLIHI